MAPMPSPARPRLALVAGPSAQEALAELVEASPGAVLCTGSGPGAVPDRPRLVELAADCDAILVVGPRSRSPRTVLPGPVVTAPDGRAVPVAWLPDVGALRLGRFAAAAAAVHRRGDVAAADRRTSLAVLAERHPRFDRLAERIVRTAPTGVRAQRWTAYELSRDDLAARLAGGPAMALYVGHGRPIGWVGYAGLRAHHLDPAGDSAWQPAAAVVSLTCRTASRRRTGLSFAEALVVQGAAAATLGAVGPTLHTANARWAVQLSRGLPTARTLGDLVAAVAPRDPVATAYRLVGDPTAPLLDGPLLDAAPWLDGTARSATRDPITRDPITRDPITLEAS